MRSIRAMWRRSHVAESSSVRPSATNQYMIGKHPIVLPASHMLPVYQAKYELYDRFLAFLCATITNSNGLIIDIGANVGDTAYAMAQACNNKIVCIEAEPSFFSLLCKNLDSLPYDKNRFQAYNTLVGTGHYNGVLVKSDSTASVHTVDGCVKSHYVTLDQFILDTLNDARITLIKVDTDGFDGDVLISGLNLINRQRPLLFWENQFDTPDQRQSFLNLYDSLEKLGYKTLWIFDNFGAPLLSDAGFDALRSINNYLTVLNDKHSARTFYYVDVLASTDENIDQARKAFLSYQDFISQLGARAGCSDMSHPARDRA